MKKIFKFGFIERILEALADFSSRYPWHLLTFSLILTVIAGFFAVKLRIELGFINLMPEKDDRFQQYKYITGEFGGTDLLIVVLETDDIEKAKIMADTLARRFKKYPEYIRMVDYKIDIDFFEHYGLYFLNQKDLKKLEKDLKKEGWLRKLLQSSDLISFYNEINRRLFEYSEDQDLSGDEEDLKKGFKGIRRFLEVQKKYFNDNGDSKALKKALEKMWMEPEISEREIVEDGYYISKDKKMLLIILKPTNPEHNMGFFQSMSNNVEKEINEVQSLFPDVNVKLTGMVKMMAEDWDAIMRDLKLTGTLALLLIFGLFIISFRNIKSPFIAAIPLVMGIIWTLGLTQILIGRLNVVTSIIAPILLGLGVDFTIHIISRFQEEKGKGKDFEEAIRIALSQTGHGVFIGAVTTSFAFFSLMFGDFKGIQEMGIVIGIGLLLCLLAVFLVLPPLLYWFDKKDKKKKEFRRVDMEVMESLGRRIIKHPRILIFAGVLISIFMGAGLLFLRYEYNSLALLPKIPSVDIQNEVSDKFDMSFDFGILMVPDIKSARKVYKTLKDDTTIGMVDAPSEYIPENQKQKIPVLRSIYSSIKDLEVSASNNHDPIKLTEALKELKKNIIEISDLAFISGLDVVEQEAQKTLEVLEENLKILSPKTDYRTLQKDFSKELKRLVKKFKEMAQAETLSFFMLPEEIKDKFVSKSDGFAVYVYPKGNIWDERNMETFNNLLLSLSDKATGSSLIWARVLEYLRRDIVVTTSIAAFVIFIILLINFRSLLLTLLTMIPVSLAVLWTLGTMGFLGLTLNFASIVGIPLILGIGIDDGVHIVHRYRLENYRNLPLVLRSTGRAILLTTLTTASGFGVLIFALDKSIWFIGTTVAIGITFAYFATIFVLVPILSLIKKNRKTKEEL